MTPNEYQKEALRTEGPTSDMGKYIIPFARGYSKTSQVIDEMMIITNMNRLLNGLMGLNGEAGECIDLLKKSLYQGHELDREHLARELGDVAWYLAVSADALGYKLEDILRMNVEKLRARYPDGFEAERSVNRTEEDV